jgi:hypothetical protein
MLYTDQHSIGREVSKYNYWRLGERSKRREEEKRYKTRKTRRERVVKMLAG